MRILFLVLFSLFLVSGLFAQQAGDPAGTPTVQSPAPVEPVADRNSARGCGVGVHKGGSGRGSRGRWCLRCGGPRKRGCRRLWRMLKRQRRRRLPTSG